jgi:hypothetical protein
MVGFNSTISTLYVGPKQQNFTNTGNVGIGTTDPTDLFQVGDGLKSITLGSACVVSCGYLSGYIGFNARRKRDDNYEASSSWTFSGAGHSGGGIIGVDATGPMIIAPVDGHNGPNGFTLNDADQYSKRVMMIFPRDMNGSGWVRVNGLIEAKEMKVTPATAWWPDFVFENKYKLKPLEDVEKYIIENKHLEGVPSSEEVATDGINLGEMNAILLRKIEELTLYMIELKKENEEIKKMILKSEKK